MGTPASIPVASGLEGFLGSFKWSRERIDQALREDPERLKDLDSDGSTALHALVNGTLGEGLQREDLGRVRTILDLRNITLINRGDKRNMTPVYLAVMNHMNSLSFNTEVLQALLEAGADPNLATSRSITQIDAWQTRSATPLFNALRFDRPDELIQLLIAYGGEAASIKTDPNGSRAVPLSTEGLGRLAANTESVKQKYMLPLESHLGNRDVAGIIAAYAYPKGPITSV